MNPTPGTPPATTRKAISKQTRFEVFKRDAFTCQYCGRAAPSVVLELEHLVPVARGGGNELLNLLTSCEDCNAGKGVRLLSDDATVRKQHAQLAQLSARREQLQMLLEWRQGLLDLAETEVTGCSAYWNTLFLKRVHLNPSGIATLRTLVRAHGTCAVLEAMDVAVERYADTNGSDAGLLAAAQEAFDALPGIARVRSQPPEVQRLYYARGILRNRLQYVHESRAMALLRQVHRAGYDVEDLVDIALEARSWTDWQDRMCELLDDNAEPEVVAKAAG